MKLWRRQWAPDSTGDRAACIAILRNVDWIDWRSETKKSPRSDRSSRFGPSLRRGGLVWEMFHALGRIEERTSCLESPGNNTTKRNGGGITAALSRKDKMRNLKSGTV